MLFFLTLFNIFWSHSIFFDYGQKWYFTLWVCIFEHGQKYLLSTFKNIELCQKNFKHQKKYFWTSRWIRHSLHVNKTTNAELWIYLFFFLFLPDTSFRLRFKDKICQYYWSFYKKKMTVRNSLIKTKIMKNIFRIYDWILTWDEQCIDLISNFV